jgi:hypothetical protein
MKSDFRDRRKIVTHSFDKTWLEFLDAFRTLCINSKGEIELIFEELRARHPSKLKDAQC